MKIDTKIIQGLKQAKLNQRESYYDAAVNALLDSGFETDDNKFFEISAVASGQSFKLQIDLDNAVEAICTIVYSGDDTEVTKTYIDLLDIPERFEDVSKKTIQDSLRKMGEGLADLSGLIMES